ncbi:virulence factor Mce family protein [Dietzia kunjamensis subsp. schimae]|uniref:MCE family protein n=2 Tax=Dietzia TaxID=37914 RepID=A0AAE4QWD8_9ACTN|nr:MULTISPECIES: MCE family protein [Dietzia]MBB1013827.1 MCE family protein [Dietzia kunjamensis subsp. schimae]MDV6298383.1 MCE family protein [Dietzia maris]MEB8327363.1 MCE family protein [Dietzia kunjamensis]SMO82537.1 virulence factor Mce family protein [Dietzia kunjamensis subsp. schimae]
MHKKLPYWLVALLLVVVVAIVAVVYLAYTRLGRTTITATFPTAVGISEGSDVRILGVTVGSVDEVTPMGETVEVRLHVQRGVDVPADARAVQVTPSVIPDRNVQLLPAYSGGPKMESGAHIPLERTATPVEVDELYESVRDLTEALGPEGANKDGALDRFVTTSAETLGGNGAALGRSIDELSQAATTLADSSQDISETVVNLQSFVTMLAQNDAQVRQFNSQMATFNQTVAGQRENLQGALAELSYALADVARLVRDNQDVIRSNADRLVTLSQITADQRDDVEEILKTAPLALSNLIGAYDAESGTLSMRPNIPEKQDPAGILCQLMTLGRLNPGDQMLAELDNLRRADIEACEALAPQRNAELRASNPDLPLGILAGEMKQSIPVPGTVQGNRGWPMTPASEGGRG